MWEFETQNSPPTISPQKRPLKEKQAPWFIFGVAGYLNSNTTTVKKAETNIKKTKIVLLTHLEVH